MCVCMCVCDCMCVFMGVLVALCHRSMRWEGMRLSSLEWSASLLHRNIKDFFLSALFASFSSFPPLLSPSLLCISPSFSLSLLSPSLCSPFEALPCARSSAHLSNLAIWFSLWGSDWLGHDRIGATHKHTDTHVSPTATGAEGQHSATSSGARTHTHAHFTLWLTTYLACSVRAHVYVCVMLVNVWNEL